METDLVTLAAERVLSEEGYIDHMYQDTRSFVTIAAGHMLATVDLALTLPFRLRATNELASPIHIQTDFRNVKSAQRGMRAEAYKRFTALTLIRTDGIELMSKDIAYALNGIRKHWSIFDSMPLPAQQAVLDMAYNLGVAGVMKYNELLRAASAGDWRTAAAESFRHGIGAERNQRTHDLFTSCLKVA